jgi:adenylate kinase family enzyme
MRILLFGNSGSGKTTLARALSQACSLPHLDLDQLAWDPGPTRRPHDRSRHQILEFLDLHSAWVVEGCYGDLVEVVVPHCSRLVFLNPGVEACVANCRARPWEPAKFDSPEAQDEKLAFLLDWVRSYPDRQDEFSLARHRAIFDGFVGSRIEIRAAEDANPGRILSSA